MRNRNSMMGGDIFSNIFAQTFNTLINDTSFIEGVFNGYMNDDLLNDFNNLGSDNNISINMREEIDRYVLEGVFPGMDRRDIKIDYKDDYIYVNAKRKQVFSNGYNVSMTIMQFGDNYKKEFYIPNSDPTGIYASFENFNLKLEIPKLSNFIEEDIEEYKEEEENLIVDVIDFEEE